MQQPPEGTPLLPIGMSSEPRADIGRARVVDEIVGKTLDEMFDYRPWSEQQIDAGLMVRQALRAAAAVIISNVPPCPDRTVALRKLREARMDANSAITHGKY